MTKTPSTASARDERTRTALLEAGARLFLAYGFRHTSMEGVAQEAQVAKATAYARFANKEALFTAVCTYLAAQMIERAEAAAAAADTPEAAVLASLSQKQLEMFTLVHQSRHAAELLTAFDTVGGAAAESTHAQYHAALGRWLKRCRSVGPKQAHAIAALLDHAAWGLASRARDEASLRKGLALLCERVVGGGK